jgi:hypothetical protein
VTRSIAKFLIETRLSGASFERTLTLGRQSLFVTPRQMAGLLSGYEPWPLSISKESLMAGSYDPPSLPNEWFADTLLRGLGASEIEVMDASPFEGATILHDLNDPVPGELHERFDVVLDGGSLEHVFNYPVALKSAMEMVREGGHLVLITPANNFFGHGFYQLSPELFYGVLNADNGFTIERMVATEEDLDWTTFFGRRLRVETSGPWYEVRDPREVGDRVQLVNDRPVFLYVSARRSEIRPVLRKHPVQADYEVAWEHGEASAAAAPALKPPPARPMASEQTFGRRLIMRLKLDWLPRLFSLVRPWKLNKAARHRSFKNRRAFTRTTR